MDNELETLGCGIQAVLYVLLVIAIVTAVTVAVISCLTAGIFYGAGKSLGNYGLALRRNVHLERATT